MNFGPPEWFNYASKQELRIEIHQNKLNGFNNHYIIEIISFKSFIPNEVLHN